MATATIVNGLSVQGIQGMVELVKAQPQVARAVFYATTIWKSGFHNEATVKTFSLGGARDDALRSRPASGPGLHSSVSPSRGEGT